MSQIFLIDNQALDPTSITASSSVMPVENILNSQRRKIWRSGMGQMSSIDIQLANVAGISYVAFVDLNLTTAGVIQLQAWTDGFDGMNKVVDMMTSPTLYVDSSIVSVAYGMGSYGLGPYGQSQALADNTRNITLVPVPSNIATYWRFRFTDMNTDFQQLGYLFMGQPLEFEHGITYGWTANRVERTVRREALSGASYYQKRDSRLRLNVDFDFLNDEERTDFLVRYQTIGESTPVIFSIFPESSIKGLTTTLYGRFESVDIRNDNFNINGLQAVLTEEL